MLKKILHAARAIRTARATRAACRPVIEGLEDRRLFAAPQVTVPIPRDQRPGQENVDFSLENALALDDPNWQPSVFEFENGTQQLLRYGFDQNVSASLDTSDLWLSNLTTSATVTAQQLSLQTTGNSAVFTTPGYGEYQGLILPNGNYEAILNADGIENAAHEKMAADRVDHFFMLLGDLDHNRQVDGTDYFRIDAAFNGQLANGGWVNGDQDYSGAVDGTDYFLIDSAFNTALPLPLPPDQPNLLEATASVGRGRVDLAWTAPQGAVDGFHIDRSTDGGATWTLHDTVNDPTATSWYEEGLDDGAKYRYRVRAFTVDAGESAATNKADVVTNLPGPGFLTTSLLASDSVTIHWQDNTDGESGYELVKVENGVETTIPLPAGTSSYRVTGLNPATTYGFRVRAVNAATESCPSPTISVTTLAEGQPTAPTNVSVDTLGGHDLRVWWQDNSDNESGFTIQQLHSDGTSWVNVASVGENATNVTIGSLFSLSDYTFRVIANAEPAAPPPGGGGVPTPPPDSPPSDSAQGSTDYGDGIVYSGKPNYYEQTADGVTADWAGPYDQGIRNDSVTVTLHNLPEHYGLSIDFVGQGRRSDFDNLSPTVTLTAFGQSDHAVVPWIDSAGEFGLHVEGEHNGTSATVTISGSGFAEDDPVWAVGEFRVKLQRYRMASSSDLFTIGKTDTMQVAATKADGTPASGITLNVDRYDSIVEPQDSTITLGADGTGIVHLKGKEEGAGTIVFAAEGGGKLQAPVNAAHGSVSVDGSVPSSIYSGQDVVIPVKIKDAKGGAWNNEDVEVSSTDDGSVSWISSARDQQDPSRIYVAVRGKNSTKAPVTITIKAKDDHGAATTVVLSVKKVKIVLTPNPPPPIHVGGQLNLTAKAVDAVTGQLVTGQITLTPSVSGDQCDVTFADGQQANVIDTITGIVNFVVKANAMVGNAQTGIAHVTVSGEGENVGTCGISVLR